MSTRSRAWPATSDGVSDSAMRVWRKSSRLTRKSIIDPVMLADSRGPRLGWRRVNVLIATDMEGIAGIEDYRDCLPSHPGAYARGRRLMTDEVLAVVTALRDGGAERITVGDWHMVGTNIERERMPAGVEVRPIADLALTEAEPSMSKAAGGGEARRGRPDRAPREHADQARVLLAHLHLGNGGPARRRVAVRGPGVRAGPRRRGDPGAGGQRRQPDARDLRRGRARQRRPGHGQGGPGSRRGPLAGPGHGPGRARVLGRRRAGRPAGAAPAPLLSGRAADHRRRRGAREHHRLRARGAAGDDRDRLPLEPGLTRVPPAGEAAAGGRGVPGRSGAASAACWRRR